MEATAAPVRLHASADEIARDVTWRILVGASAGAIAGVLVGGVGGRVAMLLLRLTSPDSVIGVTSDDGFEIGVFSLSTLSLLQATAGLGVAFGALYAVLRPAIPERLRVPLWTTFWAAVGGTTIVNDDGVDFTLLEPALLAIPLFVALPAAGAAGTAMLVERWSRRTPWGSRRFTAVLLVTAALGTLAMLFAAALAAVAILVSLALEHAGGAGRFLRRAAVVVVPVALGAATAVAAVDLVRESTRILD